MMSKRRQKEKTREATTEDDASKNADEELPVQTFDEYQCSGIVETDFPELCALLDMENIPAVCTKPPASSATEAEGDDTEERKLQKTTACCWKPCLQVELESEDPVCAKKLKVSGWIVDEQMARVLQKMLPSLSTLQSLQFCRAGLTDRMLSSFMNTISLCSNLSAVTLEGNPLPEQSYHLLLSGDSAVTHLFLRNNRMGDEGARLIGSALSTPSSSNRNLLSLNLAFNRIGDAGAAHIAQGLRLNRCLLFLSLSNNQIGDSGAAHLAETLGRTCDEVVERKKLLLSSSQEDLNQPPTGQLASVSGSTSLSVSKGEIKGKKKEALKKDEKPPVNKEDTKSNRKSSGKMGNKEGQDSAQEGDAEDLSIQPRDGELILPGNTNLVSLNLAGNRITEKSLPLFLKSLEMQDGGGELLRLCLQRNSFSPDCEIYVKIKELMTLRDPFKSISEG